MGDDELNFTEEEAQCWADDPRNQAEDGARILYPLAILAALVLVLLLVVAWFSSVHGLGPRAAMQDSQERPDITLPAAIRRV